MRGGGFILPIISLLLSILAMLMLKSIDIFILETKIQESETQKITAFYKAEAELEKQEQSLEKNPEQFSRALIKTDVCQNRDYELISEDPKNRIRLKATYRLYNQHPKKNCKKPENLIEKLEWRE